MNRKRYGTKAKPVRKQKIQSKFEKPSSVELRSIYAKLKKSASWQIPDVLAEAIQWYRRLMVHLYEAARLKRIPPNVSQSPKIVAERNKCLTKAQTAKSAAEKTLSLTSVVWLFEKEAKLYKAKVPLLSGHLKKAKTSAKKLDARKEKVEVKFDSLLTILSAASSLGVDMRAMPYLNTEDWHYDPTLSAMVYSRDALVRMKKRIRAEGVLPVMLEQIVYIARASAMKNEAARTGRYLVDNAQWVQEISKGLTNLCKWLASNQDAPTRLIKRTQPKKKRNNKRKENPSAGFETSEVASMLEMSDAIRDIKHGS